MYPKKTKEEEEEEEKIIKERMNLTHIYVSYLVAGFLGKKIHQPSPSLLT